MRGFHVLALGGLKGVRKPLVALKGGGLGFFHECFAQCPKGFEKVVLKKGDPSKKNRGTCICRLDPFTRKKFSGEKNVKPEAERKPYGSWKRPVHLRRRSRKFAPGLTPRDIKALT